MVVDARPEISGERLACTLLSAGIKCSHMALDALTHMIKSATKVMLGASAVKSNGAAVARAGSALVAMASANARKPVLICAQSIKFHDEVQLESITSNEQGDPLVCPTSLRCVRCVHEHMHQSDSAGLDAGNSDSAEQTRDYGKLDCK